MLRPRQARSIGGQKSVTLNELLQIHDQKIIKDALASQPHANFCKMFGNFCQPSPHPGPPPALFARAECFSAIHSRHHSSKTVATIGENRVGKVGMEVLAFCQHLPTWYFVPELVLELVTPVLELVTSSGQF